MQGSRVDGLLCNSGNFLVQLGSNRLRSTIHYLDCDKCEFMLCILKMIGGPSFARIRNLLLKELS